MRRLVTRAMRWAVTACLVLVVAACSTVTGVLQGGQVASPLDGSPIPLNPSEGQVIASGRAVDDAGAPMVDVMVFVLLEPSSEVMASVKVGDRVPQVALAGVTSGADGRFTIRLSPTEPVKATARDNNGFINLSLMAVERWPSQGNDRIGMGGFPLSVTAAGFEELPAELTVVLAR